MSRPLRPRKIIPETAKVAWVEETPQPNTFDVDNDKKELQIPLWNVVTDLDNVKKFNQPTKYIKFQGEYNIVEYELDEEDEIFLSNKYNIEADLLETAIDYFEKESFAAKEHSRIIPIPNNESSVCCVCLKAGQTKLLQCKGCDIFTHACCNGLKGQVKNWYCVRCENSKSKKRSKELCKSVKCVICGNTQGSMISYQQSYAHNVCVMWLSGFSFGGETSVKQSLYNKSCVICKKKGNLIRCAEQFCKIHYHGMCAQEKKYYFDCGYPDRKSVSYCESHSVKRETDLLESLLSTGQTVINIGTFLNSSTRVKLERLASVSISEKVFEEIWRYWKKKRLALENGRLPLLSRLSTETKGGVYQPFQMKARVCDFSKPQHPRKTTFHKIDEDSICEAMEVKEKKSQMRGRANKEEIIEITDEDEESQE